MLDQFAQTSLFQEEEMLLKESKKQSLEERGERKFHSREEMGGDSQNA